MNWFTPEFIRIVRNIGGWEETPFPARVRYALDWSGNDADRVALTGVEWKSDGVFSVYLRQFSEVVGMKSEVLESALTSNGFVRISPVVNDRCEWKIAGDVAKPSKLRFERIGATNSRAANSEYNELAELVFKGAESVSLKLFTKRLFERCWPFLIDFDGFSSAFPADDVSAAAFADFFSHFGPMDSLVAKFCQYQQAKAEIPSLVTAEANVFRVMQGRRTVRLYNNPTKRVGEFFLFDGAGRYCESWRDVPKLRDPIADADMPIHPLFGRL
jgi:hypothetical protein